MQRLELPTSSLDFTEIAQLADQGMMFVGCRMGMSSSRWMNWQEQATSNKIMLLDWIKGDYSLVTVTKRGHSFVLDMDDPHECASRGFKREWLDNYYAVDTPSGGEHHHGLHDAITDGLGNLINIYRVKGDPTSGKILELKLNNQSVAAPTAERIGQEKKRDGVYKPRLLGSKLKSGIHPGLLTWLREWGEAPKVQQSKSPRNQIKFHPQFEIDEFLEHNTCTEDKSYESEGSLWVVVECCPLCGKDAVDSTGLAGISKFVFPGNEYGYVCHACGVNTRVEYEDKMRELDEEWEPWPYMIYADDDDELLFNNPKFPVEWASMREDETPNTELGGSFNNAPSSPNAGPEQEREAATRPQRLLGYSYSLDDTGNAERLVRLFGEKIRFIYETGEWMVWTKSGWRKDADGKVMRMTKKVVEELVTEAKDLAGESVREDGSRDEDKRQRSNALASHAKKTAQKERRKAIVELAAIEKGVVSNISDWDADDWLFSCENGVIELKSQLFRERKVSDLCMKQSPVNYDPTAKCPLWEAAMHKYTCGDQSLIQYLQTAWGVSLTSDTSLQCLFFNQGAGENGKDTAFNTITEIMGTYAQNVNFMTFAETKYGHSEHRNDLAALAGAVRMITSCESSDGHSLDEGVIKQVTGCSPVTCRQIHGKPFTYKPQFKMWFMSNYEPVIKGNDWGIWRRVKKIPWNYTIRPEEKDPHFPEKLKAELPGILNWMMLGLKRYLDLGHKLPKCELVDGATAKYKEEMDIHGRFEREQLVFQPGTKVFGVNVYDRYRHWCKRNGHLFTNSRRFYAEFRRRHPDLVEAKGNKGALFEGVMLVVPDFGYFYGDEGE